MQLQHIFASRDALFPVQFSANLEAMLNSPAYLVSSDGMCRAAAHFGQAGAPALGTLHATWGKSCPRLAEVARPGHNRWLRVKIGTPNGTPAKWKEGLKPAIPWWFCFQQKFRMGNQPHKMFSPLHESVIHGDVPLDF